MAALDPNSGDGRAFEIIESLGRLMWSADRAALVFCIDQVEDLRFFQDSEERFQRAVRDLIQIANRLPTSIIIISCLDEFYGQARAIRTRRRRDPDARFDLVPGPGLQRRRAQRGRFAAQGCQRPLFAQRHAELRRPGGGTQSRRAKGQCPASALHRCRLCATAPLDCCTESSF